MTDIDRTTPASLVELAQRAVRSGRIDKVFLGFEGLGAGFPAPIGWIMYLDRVETTLAAQLGGPGEADLSCGALPLRWWSARPGASATTRRNSVLAPRQP
ncbi:hypothetical protein [Streptomyces atratus]|uniref:hypothetical protein n=1 Tax=Streptomyces atratus TaxID=1893 RepID=UPI003657C0E4